MNRGQSSDASSRSLWYGILFSALYCGAIYVVRPYYLLQDAFERDTGYWHYYWKLPNPTIMTRVTAWGGYLLHQAANWYFIYYGQSRRLKYTSGLHAVNVWALVANAVFVLLHLVQSAIWYDGLAQDVVILSSQGSVVLLLVLVLLMEQERRGLFFGKSITMLHRPANVIKHYHGYIFSWAITYTFWYHPMESTSGHLMGTFYSLLIMLQGSLFFTRVHKSNRWWLFVQEAMVLVHGTAVAFINHYRQPGSNNLWKMFFFGFGALVVVTQIYGLGLSKWQRWTVQTVFVGLVTFFYHNHPARANEVIRIPIVEYFGVFLLAGLIWMGIGLQNLVRRLYKEAKRL